MKYQVGNPHELIDFLKDLHVKTEKFLKSDTKGHRGLEQITLDVTASIHLTKRMCDEIINTFTYFKGTINGNNHTITAEGVHLTSLFTSLYYSKVSDLTLYSMESSAGIRLAHEAVQTNFFNINVEGTATLTEPTGFLLNQSTQCEFNKCNVYLLLEGTPSKTGDESITRERQYYGGGLVGSDLKSLFSECTVSIQITTDRCFGGLVGVASGTAFYKCKAENTAMAGYRELALFASNALHEIQLVDCEVLNSSIKSNSYSGALVGRSTGSVIVSKLKLIDFTLKPLDKGSYLGGIAGELHHLTLEDSVIKKLDITGHFAVAGLTPNLDSANLSGNEINASITIMDNRFVKALYYPLVRNEFLSISGGVINIQDDNTSDVLVDLDIRGKGGKINPFKEGY